jgi:hypothetical protein
LIDGCGVVWIRGIKDRYSLVCVLHLGGRCLSFGYQ